MNYAVFLIYSDVTLHPKVPLVVLLCRAHLWIARLGLVLGGISLHEKGQGRSRRSASAETDYVLGMSSCLLGVPVEIKLLVVCIGKRSDPGLALEEMRDFLTKSDQLFSLPVD